MRSILVPCILLGLPACAADEPGAAEEARTGGTAVVLAPTDPGVLNPLVASDEPAGELLRHALHLTLVDLGPDLEYRPRLASSWAEDGDTAVVFHLRRDVHWEDGRPTTAADVAFTFERVKDPATAFPFASRFAHWTRVETPDSFTVRAVMEPHPEALAAWAATPIVARHHLEHVPPEELRASETARTPLTNGPFRLLERRANDRLVLEANASFPEELGGRPYLDRVVYRVVPDPTAQIAELRTGRADVLLNLPLPEATRLGGTDAARVIRGAYRQFAFIAWNGRRPPLERADVRRALTIAMDRQEMVELLRSGFGEPAVGPLPPSHWGFADDLAPLPYDPDASRALLDAAGIVDRDGDGWREAAAGWPFMIELRYPAQDPVFRDAAELIRGYLAEVGVRLVPRGMEGAALIGEATSAERPFDAVLLSWGLEIPTRLHDLFHSDAVEGPLQLAGYRNPAADSLLDALERPAPRAEAAALWASLQRLLNEEQPWSFLYYFPALGGRSERVRGVEMDLRGQLVTLPGWWLEQERAGEEAPAVVSAGEGSPAGDP